MTGSATPPLSDSPGKDGETATAPGLGPAAAERRALRALLIGQVLAPGEKGGLSIALKDLADQLRSRGWEVDIPGDSIPTAKEKPDSALALQPTNFFSRLTALQRWAWPSWLASMLLPLQFRHFVRTLLMPRSFWENASANLYRVEQLLADRERYDVVMLSTTTTDAPGLMALATRRHPRVMLIDLSGLAVELRAWWWPSLRTLAGLRRCSFHPFLLQRVSPRAIKLAVFANRQWYEEAIQAGFCKEKAHIIYFSVPLPSPLPRLSSGRNRLLWVGRLSRGKGLHLLLDALPAIRQAVGKLSLTVIAAQGPADYRAHILATITRNHLNDIVTLRPPVERAALQIAYAEHDLLFFHSIYTDPVALVLMEAFVAGLPVVASAAHPNARLVQDRKTCLCYRPGDRQSLASAVVTLLTDARLQTQLAQNAQRLVQSEFSPERMGEAYDSLLRRWLAENR